MNLLKIYWKPIAWTIIIVILCLTPKSIEPQPSWLTKIPHFDKIVHFGIYTILGFLFYFSNKKDKTISFMVFVILYTLFLGGGIEIIQPLVGRSNELMDLISDLLGSSFGCAIFFTTKNKITSF